MSFFDILHDTEARYMLAYCLACAVPWTLAVILACRISASTRKIGPNAKTRPEVRPTKMDANIK